MLSYSDIQTMVDAGNTASEIAAALNDSGVTKTPINRANLLHLLNMRGMLVKVIGNNADEKWTGTVLAMQAAIVASGDAASIAAIRTWLSHITNPTNIIWDTTDEAFAKPFLNMVGVFADQPTMPSTEDFAAVVALGGGYKYNVTAEQVQALIDKQAKLDLIETAKSAELALLQQHGTARNRLENVEAVVDDLTLQQVTDEIAEIRTYPETYTVPGVD